MTVDARNHGDSPHTADMSYSLMSADLARLVTDLGLGQVSLAGHSMGGRTVMMAALTNVVDIDKLIALDISPINQKFDVTSNNEWNMEHFFHCLKVGQVVTSSVSYCNSIFFRLSNLTNLCQFPKQGKMQTLNFLSELKNLGSEPGF